MMKTENISQQVSQLNIPSNRIAVGNDLIHLPTFDLSFTPYFIKRGYTQNEIAYCEKFADSRLRYASTWAAKEAVYKVIKQVDENIKIWWRDIEILRAKPQGKPTVNVKKIKYPLDIRLTISHDGKYVWALAVSLIR
jgi:holo-[acyl-carrier protein] synthase